MDNKKNSNYIHKCKDCEGFIHTHKGADGHTHTHIHSHESTKIIVNRLARATGHLEAVRRMVKDERDCSEVLIQLAAVISALKNVSKIILQEHIESCIVEAIECGDKKAIDDLNKAIAQFIK
ncbi:metal-sensing transcriptional repressor [uncultured Clostridium sp.]|jgi:DNA-binding FrmR family transcriptional regulator|uniref:metal-sensing transcriptional repressor n=1 Tax=uncultured Clostridium sp. TaxID=59620 RepID=UPI0026217A7C|nr:metal-sensing transcriptional repressor [uncultured Clostridium sp.]